MLYWCVGLILHRFVMQLVGLQPAKIIRFEHIYWRYKVKTRFSFFVNNALPLQSLCSQSLKGYSYTRKSRTQETPVCPWTKFAPKLATTTPNYWGSNVHCIPKFYDLFQRPYRMVPCTLPLGARLCTRFLPPATKHGVCISKTESTTTVNVDEM